MSAVRQRAGRVLLVVTAATAVVHTVAVVLQPLWAGLYLAARYEMLEVHYLGANTVFYAGLVQVVLAVALWLVTRSRAWFAITSILLAVGESVQFFAGLDGDLAVHVPLGVAIVTGVLVSTVLLLVRPRRAS